MNVSANLVVFTFELLPFRMRHATLMHRREGFDTFAFFTQTLRFQIFAVAFAIVKHSTKRKSHFFASKFASRENLIFICKTQYETHFRSLDFRFSEFADMRLVL